MTDGPVTPERLAAEILSECRDDQSVAGDEVGLWEFVWICRENDPPVPATERQQLVLDAVALVLECADIRAGYYEWRPLPHADAEGLIRAAMAREGRRSTTGFRLRASAPQNQPSRRVDGVPSVLDEHMSCLPGDVDPALLVLFLGERGVSEPDAAATVADYVAGLLRSGRYALGEINFVAWTTAVHATLQRIKDEWDALGREPDIGEIVYFRAVTG